MRNGVSTVVFSALVAASAQGGGVQGRDRLVGRTPQGERVVVEEQWEVTEAGHLTLRRHILAGPVRSCLEVEADLPTGEAVRVTYRREDGATPVALDAEGSRLRVQVGSVLEETLLAQRVVPTAILRFLPPGSIQGRSLLVEPYAVVARGHVARYQEPEGLEVLAWGAGGVSERIRTDAAGTVVDVSVPTTGLLLRRVEPEGEALESCGAPSVRADARHRFDTLRGDYLPGDRNPWEIERWVSERVAYVEEARIPTPDQVLATGRADCVGMAMLAGGAARSLGLRARQVLGTVQGPEGAGWHQWVEVWFDGGWVPIDPSAPPGARKPVRRFVPTPRAFLSAELLMQQLQPALDVRPATMADISSGR